MPQGTQKIPIGYTRHLGHLPGLQLLTMGRCFGRQDHSHPLRVVAWATDLPGQDRHLHCDLTTGLCKAETATKLCPPVQLH